MFGITQQKYYSGSKSFGLFRITKDRNKNGILTINPETNKFKTMKFINFVPNFWVI